MTITMPGTATTTTTGVAESRKEAFVASLFKRLWVSPPTATVPASGGELDLVAALSGTNTGFIDVPEPDPSIPDSLRRIHAQSKLTWIEIAAALGVSRRTVHNWLAGMAVSPRHAADLAALMQLINEHTSAGGSPERTRGRLVAPDASGISPIIRMSMGRMPPPPRPRISAATRLEPTADDDGPSPPVRRNTQVRAVPLRPR